MKQYKSLDLAKFVCALLIIVLHTAPFSSYSKVLTFGFRNIVTVIAVPFFFVTSGFFAFRKLDMAGQENRPRSLAIYLKRLVVMYLIWSAVYFGFVVVKWTRSNFSVFSVLEYIKDFFFEGSYSTIWFLPALISAVAIVDFLHRKYSYSAIFLWACVIYVFTLGGSSYYGLITRLPAAKRIYDIYYSFFDSIKNGVCFGLIFVSMGALISNKEESVINRCSLLRAIVSVVLCGMILAVEAFTVAWFDWNIRGVDTLIMLVPFSYYLMRFLLMLDIDLSDNVCMRLRKYSILMFLCQRIPLFGSGENSHSQAGEKQPF